MNIVFNENLYTDIYNDDKHTLTRKILTKSGINVWEKACSPATKGWKTIVNDINRKINLHKGTKTNLLFLLAFGINMPYQTLRTNINRNKLNEDNIKNIDLLFKRTVPVYIDFDAFIHFLEYSGRAYVTENDKIVLYAAIKFEAWKKAITIEKIKSEISNVSTVVSEKLGDKKIQKSIDRLMKKKILVKRAHGYIINLEKVIKDFNKFRNYPEEKDLGQTTNCVSH